MNSDPSPARRLASGLGVLLALAAATGCGPPAPAPPLDVSGTWTGDVVSTDGPPGFDPVFGTYTLTLRLVQQGNVVTGTFESATAFSGTIAGGVSGDTATLGVTVLPCGPVGGSPGSVTLTGILRAAGSAGPVLDVSYQGTPCGVADYGAGTLRHP